MQKHAKIVEVAAQVQCFRSVKLHVPAVDLKILWLCDVGYLCSACLDIRPHLDPSRRQFFPNVLKITSIKLNALAKFIRRSVVLQITRIAFYYIIVLALDPRNVDGLAAASLFVLEYQDRAVLTEQIDQLKPVFEALVRYRFVVFAGVIHQQIKRASR